jgi:tetratricopeptide (TPR) repeat protein
VEAVKTLVRAEATQQPLVLILEDVHWIDKATEEVVGSLVDAAGDVPLLLVLVFRPEYMQRWSGRAHHTQISLGGFVPGTGVDMVRAVLTKAYASEVALDPLRPAERTSMAQALLGVASIPSEFEELIISKTDGNPLFIEEMTRSLLESGAMTRGQAGYVLTRPAASLDLPTTLQGVLLARIDRLDAELKEVLQVAAVIGRVFSRSLLASVISDDTTLDEHLLALTDVEFVYLTSPAPQPQYSFKHVLTQQAVYDALLRTRREALHEQIGRAIERAEPDRIEEHCELLAYHYSRSRNDEKAFTYLEQANRKAIRANAMPEAKAFFDEAMRCLNRMPDIEINRRRRIGLLANQAPMMVLLFKFAECYELLTQYEPMGRTLGDPGLLCAFYGCLGHCQWFFGELDRAVVTLNEATRLCDMAGNAAAAAYAYMLLEWTYLLQGRHDRVPELRDVALDRLEHKFDLRTHTWARAATSMAYTFEGRWDDALAESEREMRAAEELSDSSNICFAAMMLALNHAFRGDGGSAVRYGDLALQKAVTPADHAWASGFSGLARSRAGEPHRGVEQLAPLVEMQRTVGFVGGEFFAVWLGEAYWRAGQPARAVETLEAAIATYERCGMQFFLGSAHRMLAEVLDATDGDHQTGRIARHLACSMGILNKLHARNELALAYAGHGRFQRQLGQIAEARDSFTRALEIFERLGTLGEPDKVRAELAELSSP